jgi:hypothetical protein
LFATAAAVLVGVVGISAHIWNEQQWTQEIRLSLPTSPVDRAPGTALPQQAMPPPPSAKPRSDTAAMAVPLADAPMMQTPAQATQSQPAPITQTPPAFVDVPAATVRAGEAPTPSATVSTNLPVGMNAGPAVSTPETAPTPQPLAPTSPRAACAGRSNFSLVYCMEQQCERERFRNHPQCISLRATGEVE